MDFWISPYRTVRGEATIQWGGGTGSTGGAEWEDRAEHCWALLGRLVASVVNWLTRAEMKNLTGITLGDEIPNFDMSTSKGDMTLHGYFGEAWGMLCSHPDDFTPVCTTEMGELANLDNAGERRGGKKGW